MAMMPLTGLQPVLVHMSKNAQGSYSFNPVSVNFLTELTKTMFALITLIFLVSPTRHVMHPYVSPESACPVQPIAGQIGAQNLPCNLK